jgi:hypothetical protein
MTNLKKSIIALVMSLLSVNIAYNQAITQDSSTSNAITLAPVFTFEDIIVLADSFLAISSRDQAVFKTNFDYLLNTYIEKDNAYYDAVFVHLVDEYLQKGKVDWLEMGEINWLINKSNSLKATLPGTIAPKLLMKSPNGSAQFLSQMIEPTEKVVLVFWDTDCDKCIAAATELNQLFQSHPEWDNWKIMTLSSEENMEQWQTNIKSNRLTHWEHYLDPTINKDGFRNYAIDATPTIFFMGSNSELWSKVNQVKQLKNSYNLLNSNTLNESIESMASDDDWHLNLLIKKLHAFFNKP